MLLQRLSLLFMYYHAKLANDMRWRSLWEEQEEWVKGAIKV